MHVALKSPRKNRTAGTHILAWHNLEAIVATTNCTLYEEAKIGYVLFVYVCMYWCRLSSMGGQKNKDNEIKIGIECGEERMEGFSSNL